MLEPDKKDKLDLLINEYHVCHNGYNSRDQITEDEFSKLVQTFSIFITVLLAINIFIKVNLLLHVILCSIIGLAGALSMIAFLIDLESASSCKIALRKRCIEIENMISEPNILKYWDTISKRKKYREEKFIKDRHRKRDRSDIEGDLYINASRMLIILWFGLVISMIIWGNSLEFSIK